MSPSYLARVDFCCTDCHCADDTTRSPPEPTRNPRISLPNPVPGLHSDADPVSFLLPHQLAIANVHGNPDAVGLRLPNTLAIADVVEVRVAIADGVENRVAISDGVKNRFEVNHLVQDELAIDDAYLLDHCDKLADKFANSQPLVYKISVRHEFSDAVTVPVFARARHLRRFLDQDHSQWRSVQPVRLGCGWGWRGG